jgi:PAS domain-containing protein
MLEVYKKTVDWFLTKDKAGRKISIILALLAVLCYGAIQAYIYVDDLRNQRDLSVKERITRLEQQVKDCEVIYTDKIQLELDIQDLKTSIILIKASNDNLPIPFWIKDLKGKMLYVNKAFEKRYLFPRSLQAKDYIGTYDHDVFTVEEAKKFRIDDQRVIDANRPISFFEKVDSREFQVIKFPIKLGDYVYAIAGVEYVNFK